jgi:hypothetical protein
MLPGISFGRAYEQLSLEGQDIYKYHRHQSFSANKNPQTCDQHYCGPWGRLLIQKI